MVEVVDQLIGVVRAALGLAFVFLAPGYATLLALFPKKSELSILERVAFSGVLSVASVVAIALLLDVGFGIETTELNLFSAILAFTILMLTIWRIELIVASKKGGE